MRMPQMTSKNRSTCANLVSISFVVNNGMRIVLFARSSGRLWTKIVLLAVATLS